MFLQGHYQNAYVTADIHAAIEAMRQEFGVEKFRMLGDGTGPGMPVQTPHGDDVTVVKAAVAKLGNLTIELIEPVSGAVDFYREFVDASRPFTLHHMGMLVDSAEEIDRIRLDGERMGRPPVVWGDFRGGRMLYVDARATLGHYLEYVYMEPRS